MPVAIAPRAVVFTIIVVSSMSLTLLLLVSNQITPIVLTTNPVPLIVMVVPEGPLTGERVRVATTVKVAEASTVPPRGISTRIK